MRRASLLALALLAAPAAAATRANGSTLTFFYQRSTAEITEIRDALLWRYEQSVLDGLFATAARSNITVTDLGGGSSELAIALPLNAGNAWVTTIAAARCPEADTTAERRACVDLFVRREMRDAWHLLRQPRTDDRTRDRVIARHQPRPRPQGDPMRRNLAHLARSIPLHALALLAIGLSASAGGVSAPTAGIAEASALGAPDAGAIAPALELAPLPAPGPRAALYSHATLPSPLADHALRAVLTGTASQHASAPAADVDVIAREPNRIAEASAVATTTIDPARASPRLPPARAVHLPRYPLT